jgi:hypothetical protein
VNRRVLLSAAVLAALVLSPLSASVQKAPQKGTPGRSTPPPAPRAAPAASPAQVPVRVRAAVDRTAIWVGDRVTYTIDIVCNRGVEILLDDLAKEKLRVTGLDIVGSDSTASTDAAEQTSHRFRYVLTTYGVDMPSLTIEPISVRYYARRPGQRLQDLAPAGEIAIPGVAVALRSTLPDAQTVYDLRDGREAASRHPAFARAQSIGLALVIVSLAPAAFVLLSTLRRRTRRTVRRSARQLRLDHLATIERLRALDVATEDDRRRAYNEISTAVRDHIAAHAGVPAQSLTAEEIDAALATARTRVPRESVSALLTSADEARYGPAHALPSAQACRDALATAQQVLGGG